MFADIAGFTSWSSSREPTQVFILLETVYHAFDEIARKRRVYKVETVGDCYVAVAGLPTIRKDHAGKIMVLVRSNRKNMSEMSTHSYFLFILVACFSFLQLQCVDFRKIFY